MNSHPVRHPIIFGFVCFILISFLVACQDIRNEQDNLETVPSTDSTLTVPTKQPTSTSPLPTATPIPTITPSPTPDLEEIYADIPSCTKTGDTDQVVFNELLDKVLADVTEQERIHYTTLYRYLEGGQYPQDELSIYIDANHSDLLSDPGGGELYSYPMTSQLYENSHVLQTNLRTGDQNEIIITKEGVWTRDSRDEGWLFFDGYKPGEITNTAEVISPTWINFMLGGGGGLTPGIWTEQPEMVEKEKLNGEDVLHRCWILSERSQGIDGYLIHFESVYTFLSGTEVHLWTADHDSRLVRLILTGTHSAERLGEYEGFDHEESRDFLLWMDIEDNVDQVETILPPEDEIAVIVPLEFGKPARSIDAQYNELPLPEGASPSQFGLFGGEESTNPIPREYFWPQYQSSQNALNWFAGPNWYDIPPERISAYSVNPGINEVVSFYLEEMNQRGWEIEDVLYQPAWLRLFLHFKRDRVSQTIIIEEQEEDRLNVTAILPPDEETLAAIISGWKNYDEQNSDLVNNAVQAIAFDDEGNAWVGSRTTGGWSSISADGTTVEDPEKPGGLQFFDEKSWTLYSPANSDLPSDGIWALETDSDGKIWISTSEGLTIFDGTSWTNYPKDEYGTGLIQDIQFDEAGNAWFQGSNGVSTFNGHELENYPHLNPISALDFDLEGNPVIATSEGLYILQNERWTELDTLNNGETTPPYDNIAAMQIDSGGELWVMNRNGDLYVFDGESWTSNHPGESGLEISFAAHLLIDPLGRAWILAYSGGIFMFDPQSGWFDFTPDPIGIYVSYPDTVEIDPQGRIWIGSDTGLAVFTPPNR